MHQGGGAIEFLLRQEQLRVLLRHIGVCFVDRPVRLLHLGLRLLERGGEVSRVHSRDNLAGFDHVAFVGKYLGDATGVFGVDIDFIRFEPAIAEGDAGRQLRVQPLPTVVGCTGATGEHGQRNHGAYQPVASRFALYYRDR